MATATASCTGTETGNPNDSGPSFSLALRGFSSDPGRVDLPGADGSIVDATQLRVTQAWLSIQSLRFFGAGNCDGGADGVTYEATAPGLVDLAAGPLVLRDLQPPAGTYCGIELGLRATNDPPGAAPSALRDAAAVLIGMDTQGQPQQRQSAAAETVLLRAEDSSFELDADRPGLLVAFDVAAWVSDAPVFAIAPAAKLYEDPSGKGDFDATAPPPKLGDGVTVTNTATPMAPTVAAVIGCGNGVVDGAEECDDGNLNDSDGCDRSCQWGVMQIAAGSFHNCALLGNGKVRCWGNNDAGELGYANTDVIGDDETPASVGDVNVGGPVTQLGAGGGHTCALLSNGKVRCWGWGEYGQLGYGNTNDIGDQPGEMPPADVDLGGQVTQLASGVYDNCALLNNGKVRCWGSGGDGCLGNGNSDRIGGQAGEMPPADLNFGLGTVNHLNVGVYRACVVVDKVGRCWGNGESGSLGAGNTTDVGDQPGEMPPADLQLGADVLQLAVGWLHNCALSTSGQAYCWGEGTFGRLGYGTSDALGDQPSEMPPGVVQIGENVSQIALGYAHSCALTQTGKVRCWGWGLSGRTGYGNTTNIGDQPGEMPPANLDLGEAAVQIAAGTSHTCALLISGKVRCWGQGTYGQLGYGNTNDIGDNELPSSVGPVRIVR